MKMSPLGGVEVRWKFWGRAPKTLVFSRFLGFGLASRQLRRPEAASIALKGHILSELQSHFAALHFVVNG